MATAVRIIMFCHTPGTDPSTPAGHSRISRTVRASCACGGGKAQRKVRSTGSIWRKRQTAPTMKTDLACCTPRVSGEVETPFACWHLVPHDSAQTNPLIHNVQVVAARIDVSASSVPRHSQEPKTEQQADEGEDCQGLANHVVSNDSPHSGHRSLDARRSYPHFTHSPSFLRLRRRLVGERKNSHTVSKATTGIQSGTATNVPPPAASLLRHSLR